MKKSIILFTLLMSLYSCQTIVESEIRDIPVGVRNEEFITITATIDNPTKTVLDSDFETVLWKPSETIMVFSDGASAIFTSTNSTNTTTAEFNGTIAVGTDIFGVYPSTGATFSNGQINTSLPEAQVSQIGSFSDELLITAGHSNDLNLRFYNVCSGLRFTVEQEGIRAVTIKSLDNTPMAGNISIDFDENGKPFISNITNPKTEITVFAPDYGVFETGKWYYIVTLPGTFSSGIAFYFFDGYGRGSRLLDDKTITFKRSIFKQAQNLDSGVQLSECTPAPDEIWYVNRDGQIANIFFNGMTMQSNTYENGIGIYKATTNFSRIYGGLSNRLLYVIFPEGATEITELYNHHGEILEAIVPSTVNRLGEYAFQHFTNSIIFKGSKPSFNLVQDDEGDPYCACFEYQVRIFVKPEYYSSFLSMPSDCMANVELYNIPSNEIWYITENGEITDISGTTYNGQFVGNVNSLISNTYTDGMGKMVFDGDVTSVGQSAFARNNQLTSVFLPSNVISIGDYAFLECSKLSVIYIPKSVRGIGISFTSCNFVKLVLPPGVSIGHRTDGSYNLFNLNSNMLSVYHNGTWTSQIIQNNKLLAVLQGSQDLLFINNVTSIEPWAVGNCSKLTGIYVPSSCEQIGSSAFRNCTNLSFIQFNGTTPPILSSDASEGVNAVFWNTNNCPIRVPSSAVDTYKTAWPEFESRIVGI